MVCQPCVEKWTKFYQAKGFEPSKSRDMAVRLVRRVERRLNRNPSHYDYSQPCTVTGGCYCASFETWCRFATTCWEASTHTCGCKCPDPLPNSHYVSDDCSSYNTITDDCTCNLWWNWCEGTCKCGCTGACYYDCDEGFEWDGTACVPVVVAKAFGNGLVWMFTKYLDKLYRKLPRLLYSYFLKIIYILRMHKKYP